MRVGDVKVRPELTDFAVLLTDMMTKAAQLGLYETHHSIHEAVRRVGFEIENIVLKETSHESE